MLNLWRKIGKREEERGLWIKDQGARRKEKISSKFKAESWKEKNWSKDKGLKIKERGNNKLKAQSEGKQNPWIMQSAIYNQQAWRMSDADFGSVSLRFL